METQDQRVAKIKERVAAEKAQEIEDKVQAPKKSGLGAKALDLYTKALNEKQCLTLVPAGKVPNEKKGIGNHLVEARRVD
jgi:Tfp pilus assembly PilM family ATPase